MSAEKGVGCGGALMIVAALVILLGITGMGSDKSSWDCPGEQTPCESER